MIFIVVKQKVRARYADDWVDLVAAVKSATRAEPGNICFEWSRSVDDPTVYVLIEVFKDAAAGEAHVQSEHFKTASAQLATWLSAIPEIVHVEAPGDGFAPMT